MANPPTPTRREFCTAALMALPAGLLVAEQLPPQPAPPADIAAFERPRILAAATGALQKSIVTLRPAPSRAKLADAHEFYSEDRELTGTAPAFRDHADALRDTAHAMATLTSAFLLTGEVRYALRAGNHLYTWFADPRTRLTPSFEHAGMPPSGSKEIPPQDSMGLLDAVPLAEIARSMALLTDTAALSPPDLAAAHGWLRDLLTWLTTSRTALFARDRKDRVASAWLLIAASIARTLRDEKTLAELRKLFRKPTLRNQITANGIFPNEVATAYPYRNTLENFDLLAGACSLLSTPFEDLWQYDLADGPGLRSVAAFLYPLIAAPARWPYPADADHFRDLPGRRPALLLSGRAYKRPEYIALWRTLPYAANDATVASSFPISEPLLWVTKPLHGG